MVNPQTGPRAHQLRAGGGGDRAAVVNDPNLQNIPIRTAEGRRIREAFIAPPGIEIVSADYSQIELRIMAHLSRRRGPAATPSPRGEDVHRATAAEVFGVPPAEVTSEQRRYAKVINFGLIYGMSAFGLAQQPRHRARGRRELHRRYFARYPGVRALHGAHARSRRASRATSRRCSAGASGCRRSASRNAAAPPGRRAPGHQRADAGHRGRPDQARDDRGAGLDRAREARRPSW